MTFLELYFYGWKESIHGCIDSIQSLGRKLPWYIFNAWKESIWILHEEALYDVLNIFMVGKKLLSLQTLMGKQLGTVEGPT